MFISSLLRRIKLICKCLILFLTCNIDTLCASNEAFHPNFTQTGHKKQIHYFKIAFWNYSNDDMDSFEGIFKHVDGRTESFFDDLSVTIFWILLAISTSLCVLLVLWKCFKLVSLSKVDLWFWCDGWFDCCNKNKMEDSNIGPVDFNLFKQNLKSFGFVCAVRMTNISSNHKRELISLFKFNQTERNRFLENYRKVNLEYAIEASPVLNEMAEKVPELWFMLILGWSDSCYNTLTIKNEITPTEDNGINNDSNERPENDRLENILFEMDNLNGIPIKEMQPEQMSIKKLNAFRLCIILDTFFRLRYQTFEECENSKHSIVTQNVSSSNRISRRLCADINVRNTFNGGYIEGMSSIYQTMTKVNNSNGITTTEITEETSFCEHSSRANIEIKYVRNIPTHVQRVFIDIATNGCLKFPEDDMSCSLYVENQIKSLRLKFFEDNGQLNQPIICVKKVVNLKLFNNKMESFAEVNQILYFTLFDRGCIVINDFNKEAKYLEKLLSMASRDRLRKSMNFSWKGVTYVWKFLPMSANDSRISEDDLKRRPVPTLFVSYKY